MNVKVIQPTILEKRLLVLFASIVLSLEIKNYEENRNSYYAVDDSSVY